MYKILLIFSFACFPFFSCSHKFTGASWYEKDRFVVRSNYYSTSYSGYNAVRFLTEGGSIHIDSVNVISDRGNKDYTFHPGSLTEGDTSKPYYFHFIFGRSERLEIYCRYKEQTLLGKVLIKKVPVSLIVLAYLK